MVLTLSPFCYHSTTACRPIHIFLLQATQTIKGVGKPKYCVNLFTIVLLNAVLLTLVLLCRGISSVHFGNTCK